MAAPPTQPLKILMLHGFTQSGHLFRAKTRALEKNLQKAFPAGISLSYPTGPHRLPLSELTFDVSSAKDDSESSEPPDSWAWWRRKGETEPCIYEGLEEGLERVAQVLKDEGPFDGVIGFSQGGCAAALVASLLDTGRREAFQNAESQGGMLYPASFEKGADIIHPPMKFAAIYSGFKATDNPLYKAFYEPKIRTPTLHFLGTMDTVVEEKRSLRLVEQFEDTNDKVVYHPGGHFLPSSQKQYVGALIGFIKEIVINSNNKDIAEDRVEDMDVPF